jgi:hypothetical protein
MKLAFEERNCIHYKDNKLNNIELSDAKHSNETDISGQFTTP